MGSHRVGHDWSDLASAAAWYVLVKHLVKEIVCNNVENKREKVPNELAALARKFWGRNVDRMNWLLLIAIGKVLQKKRYSESGLFASRIGRDYGEPLVAQMVKSLLALQETWVWSLGQEDPLKKAMATYSNIPTWRIPWTGESGGLHSLGSHTFGYDLSS